MPLVAHEIFEHGSLPALRGLTSQGRVVTGEAVIELTTSSTVRDIEEAR